MTCCGGTAAVLSVLGFVAVLVGVATPGWFQMSMDLSSMESSDSSFGSNTLMEQMGSVSFMYMHLRHAGCLSRETPDKVISTLRLCQFAKHKGDKNQLLELHLCKSWKPYHFPIIFFDPTKVAIIYFIVLSDKTCWVSKLKKRLLLRCIHHF